MTRLGKMPSDWAKELAPVLESENFKRLEDFIIQAYEKGRFTRTQTIFMKLLRARHLIK